MVIGGYAATDKCFFFPLHRQSASLSKSSSKCRLAFLACDESMMPPLAYLYAAMAAFPMEAHSLDSWRPIREHRDHLRA
jgi:hypothetical protein